MGRQTEQWNSLELERSWGTFSSGHYANRNRLIVKLLKHYPPKRIIELCGAEGDLAERIVHSIPIESYTWSDYSYLAVSRARERIGYKPMIIERIDAQEDYMGPARFSRYDCFVCTALEHLRNDLEIIKALRKGMLVVLGLPNFDAPDHWRYFETRRQIEQRYGGLIEFLKYGQVNTFWKWRIWRRALIILTKRALRKLRLLPVLQRFGIGCKDDGPKIFYVFRMHVLIGRKK